MNLSGRIWRGGSLAAVLLAALLLIASLADCRQSAGDPPTQLVVSAASDLFNHVASEAQVHGVIDCADEECGHITHLVKSVLPGAGKNTQPLQLLLSLLIAAGVVLATVFSPPAAAVRGPPTAPLPAAGGRGILTLFCIARR
ncbi:MULTISPECIES: hypothetical protein [Nocardia]|uniref:hypothetical protein n=1 Tax=Nocardia TaxID=1817 RepID=UPI0002E2DE91|nr:MULTISPECIES: hypothetical protein [Nocardia]